MNPLTNVKNITKLNETELASGSIHKKSWHDMYKGSAWIFIGGLEYGLTEGDVLTVFSQYGEIVNINLVRDKKTGKSKGFCFLCYANQKSTVLAVDNFNGIKLCKRTIRVDHVANYKPPKESERDDEVTKLLKSEGCAPQVVKSQNAEGSASKIKKKKSKKEKKEKKRKKKRKNNSDASASERETSVANTVQVKEERHDPGYDKYDTSSHENRESRHRERNPNFSRGEKSHEDSTSRVDRHCYKTENNVKNRDRLKIKKEPEFDDSDNYPTSSKSHKRKRSISSDDQTKNYREDSQHAHKSNRNAPKRPSNHKRRYKEVTNNSSSSDDGSSTDSSSEENHQNININSRKSKHETHSEKRSFHEGSKDRSHHKSESSYTSNNSKHHNKSEHHSESKSIPKYRSEDSNDAYHSDSHYRKRRN